MQRPDACPAEPTLGKEAEPGAGKDGGGGGTGIELKPEAGRNPSHHVDLPELVNGLHPGSAPCGDEKDAAPYDGTCCGDVMYSERRTETPASTKGEASRVGVLSRVLSDSRVPKLRASRLRGVPKGVDDTCSSAVEVS